MLWRRHVQVLACPPESCLVPMVGGWPACPPGHDFLHKGIEGCGLDTNATIGTSFVLRFAIISPSTGQVAITKRVITTKGPCDAGLNYCLGQCVELDCAMYESLAAQAGGALIPKPPDFKFKFQQAYNTVAVGGSADKGPDALDFTRVPDGFKAMLAEVQVVPPVGAQQMIVGEVPVARRRRAGEDGSGGQDRQTMTNTESIDSLRPGDGVRGEGGGHREPRQTEGGAEHEEL